MNQRLSTFVNEFIKLFNYIIAIKVSHCISLKYYQDLTILL